MAKRGSCCKGISVKKKDFGLDWNEPLDFASSQWPIPGWFFQLYRILFMMYIVVWQTINMAWQIEGIQGYYFIYLTNWSFLVLAVYAVVAAVSSMVFFCKGKTKPGSTIDVSHVVDGITNPSFKSEDAVEMQNTVKANPSNAIGDVNQITANEQANCNPWYFKITWILLNINIAIAPLVTVIYWSVLHDYGYEGPRDPLGNGINVNTHAMNSVLIILDVFVSAYPVRITHFFHGILYGLVYVVFSLVYWAAGGVDPSGNKYIYPVLNWEEIPGLTVAFMLAFAVGLVLIQCIMYGFYRLRKYLTGRCCS